MLHSTKHCGSHLYFLNFIFFQSDHTDDMAVEEFGSELTNSSDEDNENNENENDGTGKHFYKSNQLNFVCNVVASYNGYCWHGCLRLISFCDVSNARHLRNCTVY